MEGPSGTEPIRTDSHSRTHDSLDFMNSKPTLAMTHFHPYLKPTLALALLGSLLLAVPGCKPTGEEAPPKSSAQQADPMKKDAQATAHDLKDYAYAQRSDFAAKVEAEMAEINRELEVISARIEKASDAAKAEAKPRVQALRDQLAKLRTELDSAKGATESAWNDVKASWLKGYGELKDSFHQARQWVSDKIAP